VKKAARTGKKAGRKATSAPKRDRVRYNVAPMADPPRIERRKSGVHGWGVFALQAIPKNKRIIDYAGERIGSKQSTPREEAYLAQGHIWCFKVNNRTVIDANVGGNIARFINHGCKGNCYSNVVNGVIWIIAARSIRKGEELTYNYNTDGAAEIQCRCRPDCKNRL
jgi:SET domain-containing protein